jgi:hypothetical protein
MFGCLHAFDCLFFRNARLRFGFNLAINWKEWNDGQRRQQKAVDADEWAYGVQ